MANFGETLKRERELREISLREISDATKINIRYLEALEQNRFDILPGGLFNKGFIRAYSTFVGIDGEAMVNNYLQEALAQQGGAGPSPGGRPATIHRPTEAPRRRAASGESPAPAPAAPPAPLPIPSSDVGEGGAPSRALFRIASLVIASGTILVVGLLIARAVPRPHRAHARRAAAPPAAAPAVVAPAETGPLVASPADSPAGGSGAAPPDPPATEIAAVAGMSMAPPRPKAEPFGPPAPPRPRPAPAAGAAVSEASAMRLEVVATGPCELHLSCDDVESASRSLQPGESVTVRCARVVTIGTSDAGALRLSLNGAPCPALGDAGSRVERFTLRSDDYSRICPGSGAAGLVRP